MSILGVDPNQNPVTIMFSDLNLTLGSSSFITNCTGQKDELLLDLKILTPSVLNVNVNSS